MRIANLGLLVSLPLLVLVGSGRSRAEPESAAVTAWMKRTAYPFATPVRAIR